MQQQTVLAHLDPSKRCAVRTALAAELSRRRGDHLVGLVPTGLRGGVIPEGVVPLGATDLVATLADHLRQRAEAVARTFNDRMAEAGVTSFEVRLVDAGPEDAVVQHGRTADLIVLGQDERDAVAEGASDDLARRVLMAVGRPILVVPYAGHFTDVGRRIMVAWDGSREAAVALRDALSLASAGSRVTLVSFGYDPCAATDDLRLRETKQWLARHGVEAEAEYTVIRIGIADALLSRAMDLGADLIVMGGYGNSPLRERVFGGVTHEIL
ncbi:MAG: universal stress protein, partial [Gammaproteobacteria bacterium]|nr:universal stress protein [Gammaproteobacteria bacterium]